MEKKTENQNNFENQQSNVGYSVPNGENNQPQKPKKKSKLLIVLIIIAIVLIFFCIIGTALGNSSKKEETTEATTAKITTAEDSEEKSETQKAEDTTVAEESSESETEKEALSVGDTWTVDGQWSLTINSIKKTDERNQFADTNPKEVYIIDYSYKNLGYTSTVQDLYIDLSTSLGATAVDAGGKVCSSYPVTVKSATPTPVDATCDAQAAYGVETPGELTLNIKVYDSNYKEQTVTYKLDPQ